MREGAPLSIRAALATTYASLAKDHLRGLREAVRPNLIAALAPNRATRPYLPRRSSNRVMLRQNLASKSRQMDGDFGFGIGVGAGTVVGIVNA
jgi:hypothetical protein